VAVNGGGVAAPSIARRQPLDLRLADADPQPQEAAAELEKASPFDIPAFLRRQS